jgi:hypothetical protein
MAGGMIKLSRSVLSIVVLGFGLFLDLLGLFHVENFSNFWLAISAHIVYLLLLLVIVFASRESKIGLWPTWLIVVTLPVIPIMVHVAHVATPMSEGDTWYVTAVAVIIGSLAVRQRQVFATASAVLLFVEVFWLGGPVYLSRSGITGAELLIIASIAISRGLDRSELEIEKFQNQTMIERHEIVLSQTAREEHSKRINLAMQKAMPALKEIASGVELSDEQKRAASQLAQELDDEISGGRIATDSVKKALARARARSVEVTILDENDFDTGESLEDLLDLAVAAIDEISVGRIKLIAPKNEKFLLRLTATRPGVVTPDLDLKLGER